MIVNIVVLSYAICLYAAIKNQEFHGLYRNIVLQVLCILPIVTTIITWFAYLPRQLRLSNIYDSYGNVVSTSMIRQRGSRNMSFLPDPEFITNEKFDSIRSQLINISRQTQEQNAVSRGNSTQKKSWALVTGASRGIGRAIVISLARRSIPVILVARDGKRLKDLSDLIQECYGVPTIVIPCDIREDEDIDQMMDILCKKGVNVDVLINNAGLGDTCDFVDMCPDKMDQIQQVNIRGTTKLAHLFARGMKQRKTGRIVFVSSICGAIAGIPSSAIYAASKSYQRSLSMSLGRELESYGVGVTCVMPGGVGETGFQNLANMDNSFIFHLPSVLSRVAFVLTPELVGEAIVRAMIRGQEEVFVGWLYIIVGRILVFLLPSRLVMLVCEVLWRPLPAHFPRLTNVIRGKKAKVS